MTNININIDCHRGAAAAVAVLLVGKVVGIEVAVVAVGHLAKRVAVADVAKLEVVSAARADTARIVGDHRQQMAAEAVEIVPAAVLLRPNVAVVVPSSWRQLTAPEKSARA